MKSYIFKQNSQFCWQYEWAKVPFGASVARETSTAVDSPRPLLSKQRQAPMN